MSTGARLLVIDAVVPVGNEPHPAKVMDMLMMVVATGTSARRRSRRKIVSTSSALSIVEAAPA
jgi:ribosomal protein L14